MMRQSTDRPIRFNYPIGQSTYQPIKIKNKIKEQSANKKTIGQSTYHPISQSDTKQNQSDKEDKKIYLPDLK